MNSNRVVVGVDGSVASHQALLWAAAEAVRRRARLTVLTAYAAPVTPAEDGYGLTMAAMRERAEETVAKAARLLATMRDCPSPIVPDASDVDWEVVAGTPAGALVDHAGQDSLVVVGQRGLGGFDRVVLGSVSSAVAAMARGSVVVVPSDPVAEHSALPCDGVGPVWRVVAAVDLGPETDRVLEQAFAEAEDAAAPLLVVHAVHPDFIAGPYAMVTAMSQEYREEAEASLDRIMARWTEKFPRVEVTAEVASGVITDVLEQRMSRHDLVVVGGRKHSPLVGRVLGSVPDRLVRHAACPVMIAHEPR